MRGSSVQCISPDGNFILHHHKPPHSSNHDIKKQHKMKWSDTQSGFVPDNSASEESGKCAKVLIAAIGILVLSVSCFLIIAGF